MGGGRGEEGPDGQQHVPGARRDALRLLRRAGTSLIVSPHSFLFSLRVWSVIHLSSSLKRAKLSNLLSNTLPRNVSVEFFVATTLPLKLSVITTV